MYALTLSSFIFFMSLVAILSFRHNNVVASVEMASGEPSDVRNSVILNDLPPPDDTYTPDQRRYS